MLNTPRLTTRALTEYSSSRWRCCGWTSSDHWDGYLLLATQRRVEQRVQRFSSRSIRQQIYDDRSQPLVTQTSISPTPLVTAEQDRVQGAKKLPIVCPGCGAPSQTIDQNAPGHFDLSASRNSRFIIAASRRRDPNTIRQEEDEIYNEVLQKLGGSLSLPQTSGPAVVLASHVPICDRCHMLRYQSQGSVIHHPSLESIQAMIEESPHKYNHIYHVLDAADFPMSLVPNLTTALHLPRLRTQNRRSKSIRFIRGRTADVSFIITRSDLLAPKKEQVDALVPYLKDVLRDALGRAGRNLRLGNVRCVSAKRGWWTRTVKEEIWQRGGAGWMVGKVNVGKSALYEVVFPKGRNHESDTNPDRLREQAQRETRAANAENSNPVSSMPYQEVTVGGTEGVADGPEDDVIFDEYSGSLLPPPRTELAYPEMPTVSSLPGTTASPIRIPYGNGKGELIDLPGIHRSSLDTYVRPEYHSDMIMKSRTVPRALSLKPGQSLLLGGLIRITPTLERDQDLVFMAYPFMPSAFEPHVTATARAIAVQTGQYDEMSKERQGEEYTGTVRSIGNLEAKAQIRKAGNFQLSWDTTKRRTGPLTAKAAGGLKPDRLPFVVYSADVLVEGVGWVELACQVRKRKGEDAESQSLPTATVPQFEVFTPEGKFIALRRPMNAFLLGGPKKVPVHKRRLRPRQSIGMKKRREASQRAQSLGDST